MVLESFTYNKCFIYLTVDLDTVYLCLDKQMQVEIKHVKLSLWNINLHAIRAPISKQDRK